jgi:hypothetical protein
MDEIRVYQTLGSSNLQPRDKLSTITISLVGTTLNRAYISDMWVQLRWGLLGRFVSLISPCLLCAQSPECVDQSSAVSHQSKKIKINIVGVEFRGENSLSDAARTKLAETIQRSEIEVSPEEPDTYWANVLLAAPLQRSTRVGTTPRRQVSIQVVKSPECSGADGVSHAFLLTRKHKCDEKLDSDSLCEQDEAMDPSDHR